MYNYTYEHYLFESEQRQEEARRHNQHRKNRADIPARGKRGRKQR